MQLKRASALFIASFAGVLIALSAVPSLQAQSPYRVLDHWKLADAGWWDYLNIEPGTHRLYITRGDHVDVLDTETGKLVGQVTGLKAIHGVAFDATGKFGYISDGGANAVVVFDRSTLQVVATIPVGMGPDDILFEPATNTVWSFNGHEHSTTEIDAATRKVLATVALPGRPEAATVDGAGSIYDNIEDKNEIVHIDARTAKIVAEWPLSGCDGPSGLAMDPAGERLFPVCDGKKMGIVDVKTGKTVATAAIGDGPDAAAWSAKYKLAFASCGEGVLAVVDGSTPDYKTIEMLPTQRGARTMAYDPATDRIYLVTAEFGPRPAPSPENPRGRPPMIPGSFTVIVAGR